MAVTQIAKKLATLYNTAPALLTAQDQRNARANLYAAPLDALAYSGLQYNGAFDVSQELGNTAQSYVNGTVRYIVDGLLVYTFGAQVLSVQRVTDAPPGFNYSVKASVTTANAALGASDVVQFYMLLEGFRVARLGFGSATASPVALGLYVKAHRPGLYGGALRNGAINRSCPFAFTVNAADTWELKVLTLPGDLIGVWDKFNTPGLHMLVTMAAGSTYQNTAGQWVAGDFRAPTGAVNGVAATTDTFQIAGLLLLPGTEFPAADRMPFIMRNFEQELWDAQRFWQWQTASGVVVQLAATTADVGVQMTREMRTPPAVVIASGGVVANAYFHPVAGYSNFNSVNLVGLTTRDGFVRFNVPSAGNAICALYPAGMTQQVFFTARF